MNTILDPKVGSKKNVNIDMLKSFLEAFNRHDLNAIMNFFMDDCSFDMP